MNPAMTSEFFLDIKLPAKLAPVFTGEARYRGAYGGRGSAKSWSFADMALCRTVASKTRVLCTRELQNSIKSSVLQILIDRLEAHKLQNFYEYGESFLKSTLWDEAFIFKGLRHNYREIKSTEGIDICWIEEAETTSEESFRVLFPTVRKPGSEIWLTWNSESLDAPIHKRFVIDPPANAKIAKINYVDNPWFPVELDMERQADQKRDPDVYAHVWEGECLTRTDAQVLGGKWRVDTFDMPTEVDGGPYYGCDWGFSSDPLALIRCWIKGNRLYIDYEAGGKKIEIKDTPAAFDQMPGIKTHIVRADNARPELISHMQTEGYRCVGAQKWPGSVEDGVTHLRSYDEIVIHERCEEVAREARLWSYKVDKQTGDVLPVLIDANNHCFVGDTLITTISGPIEISKIKIGDLVLTRAGFKKVVKTFDNGLKEVNKFKFPNGKSLTGTDTHEIITIDGKKYMKDISSRDTIFFQRGDSCRLFKARKTRRSYLMAFLIDVIRQAKEEVTGSTSRALAAQRLEERRNTSILPSGKKRTGQCLKDLRSITKTTIRSITTLITWLSEKSSTTGHTTGKTTTQTIRAKQESISTESGTLPRNGMEVKREENGIANTPKRSSKTLNLKISSVSSAVKYLREIFRSAIHVSVLIPANLLIAGRQVSTTKTGFAFRAGNLSRQTNTQTQKLAQELAPSSIARVYDISVEDQHEYFANGILVSNCMDALRYALGPIIKKKNFTGRAAYAGQFNELLHVSLDELWPVTGLPLVIGIAMQQTTHCAVISQVSRTGQLRVIEEVISRDMGVAQFAGSVLRPLLASKYRGRPATFVSFRDRTTVGRGVDTESRVLLDEMELQGIDIQSVDSDLLTRRLEAVRWYLGQLSGGRPALSISPACVVLKDGMAGGYQFKRIDNQSSDDISYHHEPEANQYVLPNLALQYICLHNRGETDTTHNRAPVMVGSRSY